MSKRNKSRLTKADLGSVLRLQQDYDNLCQDVLQLMMFILDYEQLNVVRRNIKSSDGYVTLCYEKIYEAIQSGRYASKESVKENVAKEKILPLINQDLFTRQEMDERDAKRWQQKNMFDENNE
jgi:hypothetical protein